MHLKASPIKKGKRNAFHGQSFLVGLTVTVFIGWIFIHLSSPFGRKNQEIDPECPVPVDPEEQAAAEVETEKMDKMFKERTETCSEDTDKDIEDGVRLIREGFTVDPIYPLSKLVKNGLTKFKSAIHLDDQCVTAAVDYLITRAYTIASDEDKKVDFTWEKLHDTFTQFESKNEALASNPKFQLWLGITAEMLDNDGSEAIKKALELDSSLGPLYNIQSNSVFGSDPKAVHLKKFLVQIWAYMEFMPFVVSTEKVTDISLVEGAKTYRDVMPIWVYTVIQRAYGNMYQEKRMPAADDTHNDDILAQWIVRQVSDAIHAQPIKKGQGVSLVRTYDNTQQLGPVQPKSPATHAVTMLLTGYPNAAYCALTVDQKLHYIQERQFLIWPIDSPLPNFGRELNPQTFCTTLTSYIKIKS